MSVTRFSEEEKKVSCCVVMVFFSFLFASFIWGKMRTVALEAASETALRDCSRGAVGEGHCVRLW